MKKPLVIRSWLLWLVTVVLISYCSTPRSGGGDRIPGSEMRLRQEIVRYAERYEGTPYRYAGRDPKKGFDCSGFTYYVMDNFGIDLPTNSGAQENAGRKINLDDVNPGDLIFFRRKRNGNVFHVSLVVDKDQSGITVIHSVSRGVTIENITTSSYWSEKIATARNVVAQ